MITREHRGVFPKTVDELIKLPGVGKNTAGAIMAYAYNQPAVFVETNIRAVYIHNFFADQYDIADTSILPILERTLDKQNPREFYWALMDLGTYIKSSVGNTSRGSKHYTKQSKFEGSLRQIRGQVLRLLSNKPSTLRQLAKAIADTRLVDVLDELEKEKLISKHAQAYHLG